MTATTIRGYSQREIEFREIDKRQGARSAYDPPIIEDMPPPFDPAKLERYWAENEAAKKASPPPPKRPAHRPRLNRPATPDDLPKKKKYEPRPPITWPTELDPLSLLPGDSGGGIRDRAVLDVLPIIAGQTYDPLFDGFGDLNDYVMVRSIREFVG